MRSLRLFQLIYIEWIMASMNSKNVSTKMEKAIYLEREERVWVCFLVSWGRESRKGFITPTGYRPLWKETKEGIQSRNWDRGHKWMLLTALLSLSCSNYPPYTIQDLLQCVASLLMSCVFPHQSPTGPSYSQATLLWKGVYLFKFYLLMKMGKTCLYL